MVVIYRTEHVFKNILLFLVLCALNENCIQPILRKWCDMDKVNSGLYGGRLDSSVLLNRQSTFSYFEFKICLIHLIR